MMGLGDSKAGRNANSPGLICYSCMSFHPYWKEEKHYCFIDEKQGLAHQAASEDSGHSSHPRQRKCPGIPLSQIPHGARFQGDLLPLFPHFPACFSLSPLQSTVISPDSMLSLLSSRLCCAHCQEIPDAFHDFHRTPPYLKGDSNVPHFLHGLAEPTETPTHMCSLLPPLLTCLFPHWKTRMWGISIPRAMSKACQKADP